MVGRDAQEVLVAGVGTDPAEELPDLHLPSTQVRTQDRGLLAVGDLRSDPRVASPAQNEDEPAAVGAGVPDPLGLPPGSHQVLASFEFKEVDRRASRGDHSGGP